MFPGNVQDRNERSSAAISRCNCYLFMFRRETPTPLRYSYSNHEERTCESVVRKLTCIHTDPGSHACTVSDTSESHLLKKGFSVGCEGCMWEYPPGPCVSFCQHLLNGCSHTLRASQPSSSTSVLKGTVSCSATEERSHFISRTNRHSSVPISY